MSAANHCDSQRKHSQSSSVACGALCLVHSLREQHPACPRWRCSQPCSFLLHRKHSWCGSPWLSLVCSHVFASHAPRRILKCRCECFTNLRVARWIHVFGVQILLHEWCWILHVHYKENNLMSAPRFCSCLSAVVLKLSSRTPLSESACVCSSSRTARRSRPSSPVTVVWTTSRRTMKFWSLVSVVRATPLVTFPVSGSRSLRLRTSLCSLSTRRRRNAHDHKLPIKFHKLSTLSVVSVLLVGFWVLWVFMANFSYKNSVFVTMFRVSVWTQSKHHTMLEWMLWEKFIEVWFPRLV